MYPMFCKEWLQPYLVPFSHICTKGLRMGVSLRYVRIRSLKSPAATVLLFHWNLLTTLLFHPGVKVSISMKSPIFDV